MISSSRSSTIKSITKPVKFQIYLKYVFYHPSSMSPHGIDIKFYHPWKNSITSWRIQRKGHFKMLFHEDSHLLIWKLQHKKYGKAFPSTSPNVHADKIQRASQWKWPSHVATGRSRGSCGPSNDFHDSMSWVGKVNRLPTSCWFFPGFWPELGTSHDIKNMSRDMESESFHWLTSSNWPIFLKFVEIPRSSKRKPPPFRNQPSWGLNANGILVFRSAIQHANFVDNGTLHKGIEPSAAAKDICCNSPAALQY